MAWEDGGSIGGWLLVWYVLGRLDVDILRLLILDQAKRPDLTRARSLFSWVLNQALVVGPLHCLCSGEL